MADYSVLQPNKPTNLAGYCRVAYCAVDQVAVGGFPRVLASRLTDTITLASGETFSSMPLLATTLQLTEREITDTQGTRFETTLTGRLPMAVAQRDDLFRIMVQRRWLAVGTDGNGNQRLLGTPRYPARFSFEHDNAQGRNEYVVTWRAITPHPALYVESVTVPTPGVCAAASVTVNGDSPALSVASGGALDLEVVDTDDEDVGTRTGSKVTVGDSAITVNGDALTDLRAEQDLDVEVEYAGGGVVPTTISGGKVLIPDAEGPIGQKLTKTGQLTSYATGDDGDIQAGRSVDFFTLASNNPFGHAFRFTGTTGGYANDPTNTSSPDYRDNLGLATTKAGAFLDNIMIDWSTYDSSTVLGYLAIFPLGSSDWPSAIATCNSLSVGGYTSGWRLWNYREAQNICCHQVGVSFNYQPWGSNINNNSYTSTTYWANTGQAWLFFTNGSFTPAPKTGITRGYVAVRDFTVSGTTLS